VTAQELEDTAARVKSGENGTLFEQVCTACRPYLWKVLLAKGFRSLSAPQGIQDLVAGAVSEAIARWNPRKCRFIMAVSSAFLHACREEMRTIRVNGIASLAIDVFKHEAAFAGIRGALGKPPDVAAQEREELELAREALREESAQSSIVVTRFYEGATYREIGKVLGVTVHNCRQIRYENIQRARSRVRRRYPGRFEL